MTLEVSLYVGAVFTRVYGFRDATKDIDVVVRPSEVAKNLASNVAEELGLPDNWLNDHVKQFLAEKEAKRRLIESEFGEGLHAFRKTWQTLGVRYGINQRAAQEVLGHSDLSLTARARTDVAALALHSERSYFEFRAQKKHPNRHAKIRKTESFGVTPCH